MVRHVLALCVALPLLATRAAPARAQAPLASAHELWLGVGLLHSAERDASASPLLYRGTGASYAAGYAHERPRDRREVRFDVSSYRISSTRRTSIPASADLLRLGIEASYLRLIGGTASPRWRFLAGGALLASETDRTEHVVNGETRLYRSYIVSGAPALRVELDLARDGSLAYQAALPLLSGVTHPPGDVHLLDDPGMRRPRWRGPASYRQLEQRLSYSRPISSRAGLRTTLMNDLFADVDDPQHAGARSAATLAIVVWTRRGSP
jgi:hypothetical protein